MKNDELLSLVPGQLLRHKGGKLYKVRGVDAAQPDRFMVVAPNGSNYMVGATGAEAHALRDSGAKGFFAAAEGPYVHATQWQVNDKYPQGRYYQASKRFTADKLEVV